jgi:hypothetical protein
MEFSEEEIVDFARVRHGNGVQLYGGEDSVEKYEGQWEMDKRTGDGVCHYPDSSVYRGRFHNDSIHGYGIYTWPTGECYQGDWSNNKMQGPGHFTTKNAVLLKGIFVNNFFKVLKFL